MARSRAKTADAYFDALDGDRREAMATLRDLIRKQLPRALETMRYGMPTYEYEGEDQPICSLAAQKHYMALYICEIAALDAHRDAFASLDVGKSCIRFKRLEQLPLPKVRSVLRAAAKR